MTLLFSFSDFGLFRQQRRDKVKTYLVTWTTPSLPRDPHPIPRHRVTHSSDLVFRKRQNTWTLGLLSPPDLHLFNDLWLSQSHLFYRSSKCLFLRGKGHLHGPILQWHVFSYWSVTRPEEQRTSLLWRPEEFLVSRDRHVVPTHPSRLKGSSDGPFRKQQRIPFRSCKCVSKKKGGLWPEDCTSVSLKDSFPF